MAKILLVEDDNNLREIYQARLQAEGYDIVSARDGEEALVVAKQAQPDLVISDVMMPKISGFEMLDILRNTEGLKDVKVIMLTALGQAEDQSRADSLGADRYLVKSQVTLEDIVNAAQSLLTESGAIAPAAESAPVPEAPATEAPAAPAPAPTPVVETPAETEVAPIDDTPVIPLATAPPDLPEETLTPASMPPTPVSTLPDEPATDAPSDDTVTTPLAVEPTTEAAAPVESVATEAPQAQEEPPTADPQTEAQETVTVEQQIENFVHTQSGQPTPEVEPSPAPVTVEPEVTLPETTPEQEQALDNALTSLNGADAEPASGQPALTPEVAPSTEDLTSDGRSKKIIAPLSSETPQKDINQLLAEEEAKETTQPGTSPAQPTAPKPADGTDFDPNSIAL